MSRKTRKLIWSAPLVAVLAVAGALAMFAAQGTGSVFANPLPAAPSNLTVEAAAGDAGRKALVLDWDAPASGNVSGYRIDRSMRGFVWETLVSADDPHTATTYTDDTLTSEDTRWYRVFAVNDHGVSPGARANSGTTDDKVKPGKVRNLTATAMGQTQINLSWDPPADDGGEKITGYIIQHHGGEGAWMNLTGTGLTDGFLAEKTSYADKDSATLSLDPGDTRRYQVRALNAPSSTATSADMSGWVQTMETTDDPRNPNPPSDLTAVNDGVTGDNGTVNLYWFAPTEDGGWPVSHYVIQARPVIPRQGWEDLPDVAVTPAGGAYTNAAVTDAESHNFRVEAQMTAAAVQFTQTFLATWDHDGDDANNDGDKDDVTPATDATARIPLEWEFRVYAEATDDGVDDDLTDVEDNKVRRSTNASATAKVITGDRATFDHDDDDGASTPALDRYTAPRVSATGQLGGADPVEEQINLTVQVPEVLETAGVTDQTAYRIDVWDADNMGWMNLVEDTRYTNFAAERVYEHKNLPYDASRTYRTFTIQNHWRRSVGPATTTLTIGATAASDDPGKPTGLTASSPNLMTIMASWTAPEDDGGQPIDHYRFQYVIDDGDGISEQEDFTASAPVAGQTDTDNVTVTMNGDMVTVTIKTTAALTDDSMYQIRVAAVNLNPAASDDERPADDSEDWSDAAEFDTGELVAPGAVEGLTSELATDASAGNRGIDLLWNKPSGDVNIDHYVIELMQDDGSWLSPTEDGEESTKERTSYTDPEEFEAGDMRTYRVAAENSAGEGPWTMVDYPRDPPAHIDHMLGDASGLTAVNNGDGTVTLSWTPGPNSNIHWVAAARRDGSGFNTGAGSTVWEKADMAASHTVDVSNLHAGTYAFTVIAGQYDADAGTENWDTNWTAFMDAPAP